MEGNLEGILQTTIAAEVSPTKEPWHELQVAAGRDGQELGQTLHEAQQDGVQDRHGLRAGPYTPETVSSPKTSVTPAARMGSH